MMTLVDFLRFLHARLGEDEQSVISGDCRCGDGFKRPDCPDRMLDEVGVKRRIVELHQINAEGDCASCGLDPIGLPMWQAPCPTLRLLGLLYTDHEDYRDEWRP